MPLSQPCCDLWNSACYRYSKCPWKTHAEVLQCLLFRDPITTAPITSPPVRHLHATYSRARSSRNYGLNKWYMWSMSGMPEECELLSTKPLQIPFLNPVLFPQAFWVWLHMFCPANRLKLCGRSPSFSSIRCSLHAQVPKLLQLASTLGL